MARPTPGLRLWRTTQRVGAVRRSPGPQDGCAPPVDRLVLEMRLWEYGRFIAKVLGDYRSRRVYYRPAWLRQLPIRDLRRLIEGDLLPALGLPHSPVNVWPGTEGRKCQGVFLAFILRPEHVEPACQSVVRFLQRPCRHPFKAAGMITGYWDEGTWVSVASPLSQSHDSTEEPLVLRFPIDDPPR